MRDFVLPLACVTVLYCALAFLVLPQGAFFSSDEGLKFIQLQNFVAKGWGDFTIDYPGHQLDPQLNYVPINNPPPLIRDSKIFAVYPVFFPALAAPFYRLFREAGLYVIPLLSGLLTLVISQYIARRSGENDSASIFMLLGLCTPLLFYSLLFWDHTLGTLLCTLALFLVTRTFEQPRHLLLLLAGISVGLAIWVRSELYVMALVMPAAYLFFGPGRFRHAAPLFLGTVVSLTPLWVFQFVVYGDFVGPHVGHFAWLGEQLPVATSRLAVIYYTLLEGNSNLALSFLYIIAFVACALIVRSPRLLCNPLLVSIIFGGLVLASIPNILQAASGRPLGGLIPAAPLFAFSFAAVPSSSVTQKKRFLLALALGYITLICLLTPVDPGLQWGPRFLLPIMPPLTILALNNVHALARPGARSAATGALRASFLALVTVSLLLQAAGLRTMYTFRMRDRKLIEDTAQIDSPYVVSDEYGYAQYVAPLFYEKQFFYVANQEAYRGLTDVFLRKGIDIFAVVTYPVPHRNAIDPLIGGGGYTVTRVGNQLYQLEKPGAEN